MIGTARNQSGDAPSHGGAEADDPSIVARFVLWPHRSMDPRSFRMIMFAAAIAACIPLYPLIGTAALYVIGGYLAFDLLLLWSAVQLTYRSGRVREIVTVRADRFTVERYEADGRRISWDANPHWVRLSLHDTRKTPDYLVASCSGRDVEIGAFLTPGERRSLETALRQALAEAGRTADAS